MVHGLEQIKELGLLMLEILERIRFIAWELVILSTVILLIISDRMRFKWLQEKNMKVQPCNSLTSLLADDHRKDHLLAVQEVKLIQMKQRKRRKNKLRQQELKEDQVGLIELIGSHKLKYFKTLLQEINKRWLNNLEIEGEEIMDEFSTRDLKTILRKIQAETDAINFLIANNEGITIEDCKWEIQLHFMVIKECTKLLEKMFK